MKTNAAIVRSSDGVTLVGGGPLRAARLARALQIAPGLVAADGGADRLLRLGQRPLAVIGDLDSITRKARAAFADVVHHIPEQETTDFEKALTRIDAPFVIGLGFSGARLDHGLAVLNTLVRHEGRPCLILGGGEVIFAAPPEMRVTLPVGARLSLFPLARVRGRSTGLRWPIDGLDFASDGQIGTSNAVSLPEVHLCFDAPGMLVILPETALPAVLRALGLPSPARGR